MITELKGLVAYPSTPDDIAKTICRCLEELHQMSSNFDNLKSWEESDVPGRFVATEVYSKIESGNIFIADITKLNFNVVFEIGYAIGAKKRAFLIRNEALIPDIDLIRQIGIFDTLGYENYSDCKTLSSIISGIRDISPNRFDENLIKQRNPVYILLPPIKTDTETHLISRIKKARLFFRSFDPVEQGRLSAIDAIENVSCSHGVIVTLLPDHFSNATVHNIRAAFLSGLALGMNKVIMILQGGYNPIPIDYRDLVKSFTSLEQIDEYIGEFATNVFELLQSKKLNVFPESSNFLSKLVLGASAAENEFQELGNYYLETDEFRRAIRGEVQIVLGRKGAGKSALFFQLRDKVRSNKKNVVLDLKPEGFQLIKFKEQVLDYLSEGTREHTITAFWEYLILLEVCHKLLHQDQILYMRDPRLFKSYQTLSDIYSKDEYVSEGDFSERMLRLTKRITDDFQSIKNPGDRIKLNNEEITGYIYKHNISQLREELVNYLRNKETLWILFDNLDKGWPPHGIKPEDVLSLRCLIDAINKLERVFRRENIPTRGLLFIRNDVFENLVSITSDRGKISKALVDWTDPALLLELLRLRFISSGVEESTPFDSIWTKICVSHLPNGEETSHYMVDRSLMRPRSLIDLFRLCRSHAVNLRHSRIEVEDIENGEEQYSTQLVNDVSYEIQDIFFPAKDILYEFIESPSEISGTVLESILRTISPDNEPNRDKLLDLLLWYGVLGFRRLTGEPTYIYTVRYDMKRLKALLNKHKEEGFIYTINPAFWKGLEIKQTRI